MHRFHEIPDAAAIVVTRSVFKQVKLYRRDDALYVAHAGGFVRMAARGDTDLPNLRWVDMEIPGVASASALKVEKFDKLSLPSSLKQIEASAK